MAGKKQAPAKIEEDEDESWEDPVVDPDGEQATPNMRMRDWRDVERYREIKELKQLVDDDLAIEEVFENPLKQKPLPPPARPLRAVRAVEKPRAAPVKPAPAAKPVPAAKTAPTNSHGKKVPSKVRAKAHRR